MKKRARIAKSRMVAEEEPNTLFELDIPDDDADFANMLIDKDPDFIKMISEMATLGDDLLVAPLYEVEHEEILHTTEEKEVEAAIDSGCVKSCTFPEELPGGAMIHPLPPGTPDFYGAGGDNIKRHGKVQIQMQQGGLAPVSQVLEVADVTRTLHSLSQIVDTDKEVLFTKREATVVPDGALSKYLKFCRKLAEYFRKGGLYVGKMKIRVPKGAPVKAPGRTSTFGRPGVAR